MKDRFWDFSPGGCLKFRGMHLPPEVFKFWTPRNTFTCILIFFFILLLHPNFESHYTINTIILTYHQFPSFHRISVNFRVLQFVEWLYLGPFAFLGGGMLIFLGAHPPRKYVHASNSLWGFTSHVRGDKSRAPILTSQPKLCRVFYSGRLSRGNVRSSTVSSSRDARPDLQIMAVAVFARWVS